MIYDSFKYGYKCELNNNDNRYIKILILYAPSLKRITTNKALHLKMNQMNFYEL